MQVCTANAYLYTGLDKLWTERATDGIHPSRRQTSASQTQAYELMVQHGMRG